jgi:nucleoside-diphosphate-sugar epimerase
MIIGNGLISNSFLDTELDGVIIFASGVSNSKEENLCEFDREKKLLLRTIYENLDKKLIYFSTCDFYDSKKSSKYLNHKFEMETLVKENCKSWIIYRVSQIIGMGNKNNLLFNFILNVKEDRNFGIYPNFDRNLISINDVKFIVLKYIRNSDKEIINIANPKNIKVKEIVKIIEKNLNKNSKNAEHIGKNFFKIPLRDDYPNEMFERDYYEMNIKKFIDGIIY